MSPPFPNGEVGREEISEGAGGTDEQLKSGDNQEASSKCQFSEYFPLAEEDSRDHTALSNDSHDKRELAVMTV